MMIFGVVQKEVFLQEVVLAFLTDLISNQELLVVRAHPEYLQKQRIPAELVTKNIWGERYEDIRNYGWYLSRNGVVNSGKFYFCIFPRKNKKDVFWIGRMFKRRIGNFLQRT